MIDLSMLERIYFEINDECPLTDIHKACPRNADRWGKLGRDRPASNKEFVNFIRYCIDAGYGKSVCTWYYNEPLCTPDRIMSLADALPECKFILWTNGMLLKGNEDTLRKMHWIMVTRYRQTDIKTLSELTDSGDYNIQSKRGLLDSRIDYDIKPCFNPRRTRCPKKSGEEIFIDYYGNLHLCCMDWRADIEIGNIQEDTPESLINKWNDIRLSMNHSWNRHTFESIPHVCQLCTMWLPFWNIK